MKRSSSSINKNGDVNPSQSKRSRANTVTKQEEDLASFDSTDSVGYSSKKKAVKVSSKTSKEKNCTDGAKNNVRSNMTASTPCRSSISFSSCSSKTTSSSAKDLLLSSNDTPSSSTTGSKEKSSFKSNSSSQLKLKGLHEVDVSANTSVVPKNKPTKRILIEQRKKSNNSNTDSTNRYNGSTGDFSSQSFDDRSQATATRNSCQGLTSNRHSTLDQASPSSSSMKDCNSANKTVSPVHSLVEGSLEYREMKRMYLREQHLSDEWKKDYQVLKQQLARVKTSTIPRPTAEVVDWLQELFQIMNDNETFKGDQGTLTTVGARLGLDETMLITIAARTPQKSALKLLRVLYPTVGSRAACGSISKLPKEQLEHIYLYVRNLHKNLNFDRSEMSKAIGTSIRSATSEFRRLGRYRQQQINVLQNENADPNGKDGADGASDLEIALTGTDAIIDDEEKEDDDDDGVKEFDDIFFDEEVEEEVEEEADEDEE